MLIAVGVVVAVLAIGVAIWLLTGRSSVRSGHDCVSVPIASTMGGAVEHACGSAARDWCQAVSSQHDAHAQAVQAQCRIAGIVP